MTRDERERGIDDAADRLGYLVLSYGLLAIVAYRGLVERAASWDLLGLVVLGGVVGTVVRISRGAGGRRWVAVWAATVLIAGALAAVLATLRT
ncbi:MAG TPA: hypothetical protein VFY18_14665 [Candidatus Limnocylindrales bacterium]|nr:hypothetical protein [Candidatus Limnocylindrales bacterium]